MRRGIVFTRKEAGVSFSHIKKQEYRFRTLDKQFFAEYNKETKKRGVEMRM